MQLPVALQVSSVSWKRWALAAQLREGGGAHGGMGNHDDVSSPQCMFLIVSVPLLYPTFLAVSQPRSHISWATIMSCRLSLAATRKLAELCPNLESLLWTGFAWILSSTHTSLQRMHG